MLPSCPDPGDPDTNEGGETKFLGDTAGFLYFPVPSAPPQLCDMEGGEMFDFGGKPFPEVAAQNPPHSANFTFQVSLALCGGLFGPAGGVTPANLLPSHLAEDKNMWHSMSVSDH